MAIAIIGEMAIMRKGLVWEGLFDKRVIRERDDWRKGVDSGEGCVCRKLCFPWRLHLAPRGEGFSCLPKGPLVGWGTTLTLSEVSSCACAQLSIHSRTDVGDQCCWKLLQCFASSLPCSALGRSGLVWYFEPLLPIYWSQGTRMPNVLQTIPPSARLLWSKL